MIKIKRILFPDREQEGSTRRSSGFDCNGREMKLGTNLDSLCQLPELIRLQHTRKNRRVKRHRELSKSNVNGEQKSLETVIMPAEATTLPSRCIKRVMDSLASLGKVGRLHQQLTISSEPVGWRALHKPSSRTKRKRLNGPVVHKNTQRYLKGLTRMKTSVNGKVSGGVVALNTATSDFIVKRKMDTSENKMLCTGLSAMFGIIAPLYSRSKKAGNHREVDQQTSSPHDQNSPITDIPPSSPLRSLESKFSKTAQRIESVVPSERGVLPSAGSAVLVTSSNEEQRAEKTDKPQRRKVLLQDSEQKHKVSPDKKRMEPATASKRRSKRRRDSSLDNCVTHTGEKSKWSDPSSMIDPQNSHKHEPTTVRSKISKLARSVCQSSTKENTNAFRLRRSERIQSIQTQDSSQDSIMSISSACVTARENETPFLEDSSIQRKNISKTVVQRNPTILQGELEERQTVLRRSTRQIIAPNRLGDATSAPADERRTKRKRKETRNSDEQEHDVSGRTEDGAVNLEIPKIEDVACKGSDTWTETEIVLLRKSHREANPKSLTFWEDIAECVGSKSATECRERWFSFVKTPAPQSKKAKLSSDMVVPRLIDDDIFNATPMRSLFQKAELGLRLDTSHWGGFLSTASAIKVSTTEEYSTDMNPSLPPVKHGYKTYVKNMKRFVNDSTKCKLPTKKKQQKKNRAFSLQDYEGDFEVDGRLSPGGTLRINTHMNEVDEIDLENEDEL